MRQKHKGRAGEDWWDRNSRWAIAVGALVILGLIVAGFTWVVRAGTEQAMNKYNDTPLVMERVDANTVKFRTNSDAPVLDVYEDPLCPFCRQFEDRFSADMLKAAEEGEVQVQINQVNILDGLSDTGDYSTRVGGAYEVIAQQGDASVYLRFHDWVYQNQPSEGKSLSNAQIIEGMQSAGASDTTIASFEAQEWGPEYLEAANASWEFVQANAAEPGVPVVFIGDKQTANLQDSNWLKDFIAQQ